MTPLPARYAWLDTTPGLPRLAQEARRLYGVLEGPGDQDNAVILGWADELATLGPYARWAADFYNKDAIPWCGLFMAVAAARANPRALDDRQPPRAYLAALAWAGFGVPGASPSLGDVLVFTRSGGGHVGLYVGEDSGAYHVLGGNQSDAVTVSRIGKGRLYACRRPPYRSAPQAARPFMLAANGALSTNEA